MIQSYRSAEAREIERRFRAGRELLCPRCEVLLDRRRVPPRSDVSYVRDRVWLTCPSCRSTLVLDRRAR